MQVIVTGATSFVGAATVRELLKRGHTVMAVVRPASKNMKALLRGSEEERKTGRLRIEECELSSLDELSGSGWDAFAHFAWGGSGSSARNDRELQESNLRYAIGAILAAKRMGCSRFFFAGSQAEYGFHTSMITEASACAPRSAYGEAKYAVLREGEALCRNLGMTYIHGRIFSAYGPGDHPWTLVESCLDAFLNGREILLGACTQQWNFLYIDDLAEAIADLLALPRRKLSVLEPVFNLAGEETRPLRSFVEEIYSLCGEKGSFTYHSRPENAEGLIHLNPSVEKLKNTAGWRQKTDFESGIRKLILDKQQKTATMK